MPRKSKTEKLVLPSSEQEKKDRELAVKYMMECSQLMDYLEQNCRVDDDQDEVEEHQPIPQPEPKPEPQPAPPL